MNIEAVIFDWDLTLVSSVWFKIKALYNLSKKHKASFFHMIFNLKEIAGYNINQLVCRWFNGNKKVIEEYIKYYKKNYKRIRLFDVSILQKLKSSGIKIGIVTNEIKENVEFICEKYNLHYDIIIDTTNNKPKPDPSSLKKCLDKLNVSPKKAIYIGDMPRDIKMGKDIGVYTIAKTSLFYSRRKLSKSKPDYMIKYLRELEEILQI